MSEYNKLRRLLRINIVVTLLIFVLVAYFGLTNDEINVNLFNTRLG